MLINHNCTY